MTRRAFAEPRHPLSGRFASSSPERGSLCLSLYEVAPKVTERVKAMLKKTYLYVRERFFDSAQNDREWGAKQAGRV